MDFAPLVVTDEIDSHAVSSEEVERIEEDLSHLDGFQYVHWLGLPHRSVHVEIINNKKQYFVWERKDGRLEIPGGHVDWLRSKNRPETYEEAARREIVEELVLKEMFGDEMKALDALRGLLIPVEKVINQIPSSHVNNNEWVMIYRLYWPEQWQELCEFLMDLANRKNKPKFEAKAESARWMSLQEITQKSLSNSMGINAALRLFLRRQGIIVPILLKEYFNKYEKYRMKICPDKN